MQPEENSKDKDFGKVIDVLHNKSKLSSLRTYQGDMAEFIKEKNESVFSIASKEKNRKEQQEQQEQKQEDNKLDNLIKESNANTKETISAKIKIPKKSNYVVFQKNLITIIASIILLALGVLAGFYALKFVKTEPIANVVIEPQIIPYNRTLSLTGVTKENFGQKLSEIATSSGVSVIKVSGQNGLLLATSTVFFNFLNVSLPGALDRTIKDKYMVGVISQNGKTYPFLVITVNDFGNAFSAMLDWEANMQNDLAFLNVATSTENYIWKDLIVKNKDVRGLVNQNDQTKIVYTFLDKSTILITDNVSAISEISSIYASRAVVR
jgi:hypothetical protein